MCSTLTFRWTPGARHWMTGEWKDSYRRLRAEDREDARRRRGVSAGDKTGLSSRFELEILKININFPVYRTGGCHRLVFKSAEEFVIGYSLLGSLVESSG